MVAEALARAPVDRTLKTLAEICAFDRYQASLGLNQAIERLADAARRLGADQVCIDRYAANGQAQWWSFEAPRAWTPLQARLIATGLADTPSLVIDHAASPFAVAAYARATSPDTPFRLIDLAEPSRDLTDGLVLLPPDQAPSPALIEKLTAAGAAGFLTDAPKRADADGTPRRGRIELPPGSGLFAFSATPAEMALARRHAERGTQALVTLIIDESASMPVLSAAAPGDDDGPEIWVTAHLCHPRPGANDNASGAAALLGVLEMLLSRPAARGRTVRFLWGPEFLGVAAALHDTLGRRGPAGLPRAVLNLDMIGEDQALCGSPFCVEHPPHHLMSGLGVLADHVVAEVFRQTAASPGHWRSGPLLGFSDHALFADAGIARPAVQFCHAPDRFNHSAADTLDKVSAIEVRRTLAAASVLLRLMGGEVALTSAETEAALKRWMNGLTENPLATSDWGATRNRYGRDLAVALAASVRRDGFCSDVATPHLLISSDGGPVAHRAWTGPINLRAMLAAAPQAVRERAQAAFAADKQTLALLFNYAIRVDGQRSHADIRAEAALALGRPVNPAIAETLYDTLLASNWVKTRD